jgi:hypothetical protein
MKTNQKQLRLIQHGLKASTVTRLSESQVDILFNRLNESKKENKEQVTKTTEPAKEIVTIGAQGGDLPNNPTGKGYKFEKKPDGTMKATPMETEMTEDTDSEMEWLMKGDTQDPIQKGPTGDGDPDSLQEYKNLAEKFESKKQQKYFFAKCGDGKTKEQKKKATAHNTTIHCSTRKPEADSPPTCCKARRAEGQRAQRGSRRTQSPLARSWAAHWPAGTRSQQCQPHP